MHKEVEYVPMTRYYTLMMIVDSVVFLIELPLVVFFHSSECNSPFHICRELDLLAREMLLDVAFGGLKCLKQEDSIGKHQTCISVFLMR